jgi:hypothetical protein
MKEYKVKVDGDGDKYWFLNDMLHNEDGPACEFADGAKFWYLYNKPHREDGPAFEWADGRKQWFLNGIEVTEADVMGKTMQSEIHRLRGILHRHHICHHCGCGLIRADGDSCDCPMSKQAEEASK